jgi:hypothetical protein
MHISFKIIKFYFTLCCSTCFGHHCAHHQKLLIAAHAVSGHRVVLDRNNKKLLMMDTMVSETCRAAYSEIEFYDFKTSVHLVGFYSILSLMMHGTINVKTHIGTKRYRSLEDSNLGLISETMQVY